MGHFSTPNFSLAVVLASLGVPFSTPEVPEWREVSSTELEANGFATVEEAEEAGFEGSISYGFTDHPDRKDIIQAFNKAHYAKDATGDLPDVLEVEDAKGNKLAVKVAPLVAAFAAVLFKNRKKLADRRKKVRARLRLIKGDGAFAIIDRRASAETKERFST